MACAASDSSPAHDVSRPSGNAGFETPDGDGGDFCVAKILVGTDVACLGPFTPFAAESGNFQWLLERRHLSIGGPQAGAPRALRRGRGRRAASRCGRADLHADKIQDLLVAGLMAPRRPHWLHRVGRETRPHCPICHWYGGGKTQLKTEACSHSYRFSFSGPLPCRGGGHCDIRVPDQ